MRGYDAQCSQVFDVAGVVQQLYGFLLKSEGSLRHPFRIECTANPRLTVPATQSVIPRYVVPTLDVIVCKLDVLRVAHVTAT